MREEKSSTMRKLRVMANMTTSVGNAEGRVLQPPPPLQTSLILCPQPLKKNLGRRKICPGTLWMTVMRRRRKGVKVPLKMK